MSDVDRRTTRARRRARLRQVIDGFCFVFAGLAAVWLAILVVSDTWRLGWWAVPGFVIFWALLASLVLPRLHRILTDIYVPDYFIGRTRTSDGLLGDPVNLALLGEEAVLHDVMTRSGWTRADDISLRTSWGIVVSTVTGRSYTEAPVSPLFLFGKQQDFAYQQEVDGNAVKRHHVRFWRCPPGWLLPGGTRVDWLAAGTFDRAVGLSLFTLQVTHKIEADIDVERDHIVASVLAGAPEVSVHVLKDFSTGYHSRNGGGDSVHTDGDLPVIALPGPDGEPPAPAPVTSRVVELTEVAPRAAAPLSDGARKRGAYELPAVEVVEDGAPVERIKRPTSIVLGVVTTFQRARRRRDRRAARAGGTRGDRRCAPPGGVGLLRHRSHGVEPAPGDRGADGVRPGRRRRAGAARRRLGSPGGAPAGLRVDRRAVRRLVERPRPDRDGGDPRGDGARHPHAARALGEGGAAVLAAGRSP